MGQQDRHRRGTVGGVQDVVQDGRKEDGIYDESMAIVELSTLTEVN